MNAARIRRLERVAAARRRAAAAQLAAALARLEAAAAGERQAESRLLGAVNTRFQALSAGADAARVAELSRFVDAWEATWRRLRAERETAEAACERARASLLEAYSREQALSRLAQRLEAAEAAEAARRQRAAADELASTRFAFANREEVMSWS